MPRDDLKTGEREKKFNIRFHSRMIGKKIFIAKKCIDNKNDD